MDYNYTCVSKPLHDYKKKKNNGKSTKTNYVTLTIENAY
jgi:hypothetical protein